jgi:glycosyltransferase involved in cell wall biosynthesis
MLTSRFGFGYGMGYSAYKEAAALVSLGHSVTVVHCYSNPEIAHFFDPRITSIYLPMKKIPLIGFFLYVFKLKKFFREKLNSKDFDCIYIQSLEFGLLDFSRIKTTVFYYARSTMRGMQQALRNKGEKMSLFAKIFHVVLVALERRCMRYSKTIFVKSHKMTGEVSDLYGVPSNKIVIVTGGIDEKDFEIQPESSGESFRRKFKMPLGVPIVLYAGRIVPQKGLAYLIEASLKLLREINFIVVIAGIAVNESYYAKVKRRVDNTEYQTSFYFLGHIDQRDMSLVLNSADCVVTPSVYEPFGMINLQAAFLNKNIITTDVTGSIDLLANYEKIKIVHAGSSTAIELALKEVLTLKLPTDQLPIDLSDYSWRSVAEQLLRYFLTDII